MDVLGAQAGNEDPAVGLTDNQALTHKFGEGFADSVAGDAELAGKCLFLEFRSRRQCTLGDLQPQLRGHPGRHRRHRDPQPGHSAGH